MKIQFPILGLLLLLCLACPRLPDAPSQNEVEFIVLQMNDVYEIAPLEGGKAGGLARVAQIRQELLKENPNVISILSGDFLSPSFMGNLKQSNGEKIAGLQMVEALNALGLDYVTFGNHEFDISDPELLQKRIDASAFEWTVCNALRVKDGKKVPFTQQGKDIPEYIVHEITTPLGTQLKLGFLGVLLPFNKAEYVHYLPVEETFKSTLDKMKGETDLVLAITHLEIDEDLDLASKVQEIPLYLGGHDHVNMNRIAGKSRVTKADANAKTIYIHRIKYNLETRKTVIQSTLKRVDDSIEEEPKTKAVVDKWLGSLTEIVVKMGYDINKVLMTTKEPLICKESEIRSRQTNYGSLTIDAFEAVWPGADVYIINSGSMRLDDNIDGVVTEYDVLRTYPYGGPLKRIRVKGADLVKILDVGLIQNIGEGGFFQASDVKKENEEWKVNGQAVELEKEYKMVLPGFVAGGGEANLGFVKKFNAIDKAEFQLGGKAVKNDIRDIVINYMETL